MSIRNVRKLMGDNSLPPPEGNSDEEYEPLYAKKLENNFKGLEISSHSEEENNSVEEEMEQAVDTNKKKNKKKKKKQRKARNVGREPSTSKVNMEELDEIDKSILEVNAILGEPIVVPTTTQVKDPALELMVVSAKYLSATEEMNRLFGPEEDDAKKRQRQCQYKLMKRAIILPPPENNYIVRFHNGISMSINRQERDLTYFTFDHSREYQKILRSLIALYTQWDGPMNWFPEELNGPKSLVEEILHKIDTMFYVEEYIIANTMIEQCIAHLQSVVHLAFNVTNPKTRLEYKFRENRVFHVLLLKYLYLLTNKACHRTSLEVAKILLNLDPEDPLAVVLVIDTLAIRAREYKWLVDAVVVWSKERNAGFLFNIQYSHSMAHFHLANRTKETNMSVADRFLQNSIIRFPTVVLKIFEACSMNPDPKIVNHPLFKDAGQTTKNLQDLIELYARLSWSRWKEPPVMKWLLRNVNELIEKFDENMLVKELTDKLAIKRRNLFQTWPTELVRHLTIISPMSKLLVDGAVPHVERGNSFDPVPPSDSVDRYSYRTANRFDHEPMRNNVLYELFASLIPSYQTPADPQPVYRPRRHRPVAPPPVEEIQINELEDGDNDDDESVRNNLLNSAGEVRNALMLFLGEWYESVFNTDIQSLEAPEDRRQDGDGEPE